MKMFKKQIVRLIFLILLPLYLSAGGTDIVYGGDPVLSEFKYLIEKNQKLISKIPIKLLPDPNFINDYIHKKNSIKISIEDNVFLNQNPISAINYPNRIPAEIVISRSLWAYDKNLNMSVYQRLALHEMLHVMNYDDSSYQYSDQLFEMMQFFNESKSAQDFITQYLLKKSDHADWAKEFLLSGLFLDQKSQAELVDPFVIWYLAMYLEKKQNLNDDEQAKISELILKIAKKIPKAVKPSEFQNYVCAFQVLKRSDLEYAKLAVQQLISKNYINSDISCYLFY